MAPGRIQNKRTAKVRGGGLADGGLTLPIASSSKRPLDDDLDSDEIDEDDFAPVEPEKVEAGTSIQPPKKRQAAPSKSKPKAKSKKTTEFTPDVTWPDHFKQLEKAFKALSATYTFLQTRRHLTSTFENLRGSVSRLLGRELQIHDIAQIKSLMPKLVRFAYIDSDLLQVHLAGHSEKGNRKGKDREEVYGPSSEEKGQPYVLLFEFNDGELKASNRGGKVYRKRSWKRKGEEDKPTPITPTFTADSMTKMIDLRNAKFTEAVNELLVACAGQGHDAVELLLGATEDHVPVKPDEDEQEVDVGLSERQAGLDFILRNPDHRPSIASIINELSTDEHYIDQIVDNGHRIVEARGAIYGELKNPLSDRVKKALYATKGITQVYSHQALAINHLNDGKNVIVSTSTSSGKSLIYQLPAIAEFENDHSATAIYIYPTKALAQDQKRALSDLLSHCEGLEDIKIATFDGDTQQLDRDYIRQNANVIFTNPDMLHVTVLPREEDWRRFFRELKIVVVDELHMYQGLFGCHVAFVMRRLRRICAAVGNTSIKFVCCSATVENPVQHMAAIFGVDNIELVDVDGSPSGRKEYVIWNPPYIDARDIKQGRVSSIQEASRIFRYLMDRGIRTIVFCKIRRICEIVMRQVRTDLMLEGRADMASRVMSYRSGYNAQDRRKIEQEMFQGKLLGIIATTALELGIDIGSLDAVVTVGFPYTLPGFRQQAGRAGRRNKDSLAMLICDPFPLDQHYARNPGELFTKPHAQMSVDLNNPLVLEGHVQCAAEEMPIHVQDDELYFGPCLNEICTDRLVKDDEGFFHAHYRYRPWPAKHVSIRNTEDESYVIIDTTDDRNQVLEEIEWSRAVFEVFEGALFMHQGHTYLCKEVNHDQRLARLVEANVDWMTRVRDFTDVDAQEAMRIREIRDSPCRAYYGSVRITSHVFGYFKVDKKNNILDSVDIDTPAFIRQSHGLWIDLPPYAMEILCSKNLHVAGSIHAAEHALLGLTPMFVMSASGDVRTECKAPEKEFISKKSQRIRPARLIMYDASGSSGICAKAFDNIQKLLRQALNAILDCVASAACSHGNLVSSKLGARVVLECLLNTNLDVDSIPTQEAMTGVSPSATVELSAPVRAAQDVVILDQEGRKLAGDQRADVISTLSHPQDSTHSRNSSLQGIAFSHVRNKSREIDLESMRGGFLPIDLAEQPLPVRT